MGEHMKELIVIQGANHAELEQLLHRVAKQLDPEESIPAVPTPLPSVPIVCALGGTSPTSAANSRPPLPTARTYSCRRGLNSLAIP